MRRLLALLLALAPAAAGAALSPAELAGVGSTPAADAALPLGLAFVDQDGRPYRLAPAPMPTVLLFADYSCRHVCGPGLTLTAGGLHDAGLRPGRDYRLVVVGMDRDGPALARALLASRMQGLPAEARAARLLTGDAATVGRAEALLGYHARYDAAADQWAHDAAIYVFSSGAGRLSALLPETAATPAELGAAVRGAAAGVTYAPQPPARPGFVGRITAICYGLAASHGVYARPVVLALRAGGAAVCVALGLALLLLGRRRRRVVA